MMVPITLMVAQAIVPPPADVAANMMAVVPKMPPEAGPGPGWWNTLPELVFRDDPVITENMRRFVANEVAAGRCQAQRLTATRVGISVDLAVRVGGGGNVAQVMPHAIDCPTVEQYAAGIVSGLARDNLRSNGAEGAPKWYRTTLAFDWQA